MKYAIFGLGNPGDAYASTRHNVGYMVLDQLAAQHQVTFATQRLASTAQVAYKGRCLHLIKPTTYMNRSGQAVRYWLQALQVPIARALVLVDDLALPLGMLRLRAKGRAGGHNGLKSIQEMLGTTLYPRLRIGIGRAFGPGEQAAYVLGQFATQEVQALPIAQACDMVQDFATLGIARTVQRYAAARKPSAGLGDA